MTATALHAVFTRAATTFQRRAISALRASSMLGAIILAVAAAQLVPVVGYAGIALAFRTNPDDRGSKIAFGIWTATALPFLLLGIWVGRL